MQPTILVALGLVVASAIACSSPPPISTSEFLAPATTQDELVTRLGAEPVRCVPASADLQICAWRLGKAHPGWEPLSEATGSGKRINVVCALPSGFGPREPDTCSAHPPYEGVRETSRTRQRQAREEEGKRLLAGARTLLEMSRLLGDVPHSCRPISETEQTCLWRSSNNTPGHKIAAGSIGTRKRVHVRCRFPRDGGPRSEDCAIAIGS